MVEPGVGVPWPPQIRIVRLLVGEAQRRRAALKMMEREHPEGHAPACSWRRCVGRAVDESVYGYACAG